jgi:subtilisin family serine protease
VAALPLDEPLTREWAWGGATGAGVKVAVVDSGVDGTHPAVGGVAGGVVVEVDGASGRTTLVEGPHDDLYGHGTACAGLIRRAAPDCEIYSVRVLGERLSGRAAAFVAGLRWAVDQWFDVVNMSLSTSKRELGDVLHELAESAYFRRTMLVASAHNMPVESYPWRFSSVVSVGSHEEDDPLVFYANPSPPVEFFARGVDVDVAWIGGGSIRATGNSFATPAVTGIAALVLGKHPGLTAFQVKTVLYLIASNVGG